MGCEKACSGVCSLCCKLKCCPEDRPSPIFLTYTLLLNVPLGILALVLGITAFTKDVTDNPGCDFFVHPGAWLLISAALSLFFCLFALRVYRTFSKTAPPPDIEAGGSHEQCAPTSLHAQDMCTCVSRASTGTAAQGADALDGRVQHVRRRTRHTFTDKLYYTCCHDVGTFLYLFAAPFTVIWAVLGLARDGLDGCDESEWGVRLVAAVLLIYLACTIFVAMTSCLWEINRMANELVAEQEEERRQQAGPSVVQGQPVAAHQHHGPAKFVHHMFSPGFVNTPGAPAHRTVDCLRKIALRWSRMVASHANRVEA